jgi:hypothetical protein
MDFRTEVPMLDGGVKRAIACIRQQHGHLHAEKGHACYFPAVWAADGFEEALSGAEVKFGAHGVWVF